MSLGDITNYSLSFVIVPYDFKQVKIFPNNTNTPCSDKKNLRSGHTKKSLC